jgi:hypothetical protein
LIGSTATLDESAQTNPPFFSFWRTHLVLILLYTLTFFVLVSALHRQYGFPLDDSYIHQTVARNLARYGIPGFVPDQRSSGATSLIWTYLQGANFRFFHVDPVLYNLVFSWILFAIIAPVLFTMARLDGLSTRSSWILAASPALCGNFMWLGLIGMEHLLFIALSLIAIYFWFDWRSDRLPEHAFNPNFDLVLDPAFEGERPGWPGAIGAGIAVGLLAITRPEAVVFGPLLLIASYPMTSARARRPSSHILAVLAIWSAFVALILAANLYTSRSLMPATLKGRTWLYFHTSGGPHSSASILRFLGAWVQRLPRMFSTRFVEQMSTLGEVHGAFAVFGFALLGLAILGFIILMAAQPHRIGFLMLWAGVHFAIYLATFPSGGHGGRYQPLTLLFVFPCFFFALVWIFQCFSPPRAQWTMVVSTVIMLIAGVASLRTWRTVAIDGIGHINTTHGQVAAWLKGHVPPDARIAAFDIGRISYDWGYGITDLGGLVDPDYYQYLVQGRVPQYLEEKHIQYLVLPGVGTSTFGFENSNLGMTRVAEFCSPHDPWIIGFRYTIHATQCQEVFHLNYEPASPQDDPSKASGPSSPTIAPAATSPQQGHPTVPTSAHRHRRR